MTLLALWSMPADAGVSCALVNGAEIDLASLEAAVLTPACLTIWLDGGETYDGFQAAGLGRDLRIVSRGGTATIQGENRLDLGADDQESSLTFAHLVFQGEEAPILNVRRNLSRSVVRFEDSELACASSPCVHAEGATVELLRTSVDAEVLEGPALYGKDGARFRLLAGARLQADGGPELVLVEDGSVEIQPGEDVDPVVLGPFPGTAIRAIVDQCPDPTGDPADCHVKIEDTWFLGVDGPALDLTGVPQVVVERSQFCGDPAVAIQLQGSCREGCSILHSAFGPDASSRVGAGVAIRTSAPIMVGGSTFRKQTVGVQASSSLGLAMVSSVVFDGALTAGPVSEVDLEGSLVHEGVTRSAPTSGSWAGAQFAPLSAPGFEGEGRQCAEFRYHPRMTIEGAERADWASDPFEAGLFAATTTDDDGVAPWRFDCDDQDESIHALQLEPAVANGVDDDCDGLVDCDDPDLAWYGLVDKDHDGYGRPMGDDEAGCVLDAFEGEPGDCDDEEQRVNPGADELCDPADWNCDGDPTADAVDTIEVWPDADDDGFGDRDADPVHVCEAVVRTGKWSTLPSDCDDGDRAVHPNGADPVNDGADQDCDGVEPTALVGGGGCGCGSSGGGQGGALAALALGLYRRRRSAGSSGTSSPGRAKKS